MAKTHRGRNEGTISKRTGCKWRAQISLDGKRLSYTGPTRADCQAWLKSTTSQIDGGLSYRGATMKFGEFFETWLRTKNQNIRPTTQVLYRRMADKYILPAFSEIKLKAMQPHSIEQYLTGLQEQGVGDRTCQMIYALLHVMFGTAVRKGMLDRNPLEAVQKPKVKKPRRITILQPEEIHQLLISVSGHPNEALYFLAITTGLREGEILGLKWSDIDWQRGWLNIQRQVQFVDGKGLVFSEPKTQMGLRVIALGSVTLDKLREHKQKIDQKRLVAGSRWVEMDLVFPSTKGTPRDAHNLIKEFREVLAEAGLPSMRFHDLRHTSVTLVLNEIGAPVREAQHRAGHASPTTTLNIYCGSTTTKMDETIAQKLDDLVTPIQFELHPVAPKQMDLPERKAQ